MFGRTFLFILSLLSVNSVLGLPHLSVDGSTDTGLNLVDFIPPKEGLVKLKLPVGLIDASPKLKLQSETGKLDANCSGSFISDSGNILTAGHCVVHCLRQSGKVKRTADFDIVDTSNLNAVSCDMLVNGNSTSFTILAVSPCIPNEYSMSEKFTKTCRSLDYAVLSPVKKSPDLACFRISEELPEQDVPVAVIGYPPTTLRTVFRKSARNTNGSTQELSRGEVIEFQNHCFSDVDKENIGGPITPRGEEEFGNLQRDLNLKQEVAAGRLIQTTTDLLPGMSGAGLINVASGSIFGVAQFSIANSTGIHCIGDGFFGSISGIVQDLKQNYPELDLNSVFGCEKNNLLPAEK